MDDVERCGRAREVSNAVEDRARRVVRRGPLFVNDEAFGPEVDEVGECATGVDADT